MLLGFLPHGLLLRDGELHCCDPQNPRHRPLIDTAKVGLVVKNVDEFKTQELLARHEGREHEINLCETCYETIIIRLIRKASSVCIDCGGRTIPQRRCLRCR